MSKDERLSSFLSDDIKAEDETEEALASLPKQIPQVDLQVEFLRTKIDRLKEENYGLTQDRKQRKSFSYWIFGFMCAYMVASLTLVFLCGFKIANLPDKVLITLLTTSLVEVIGTFNIVTKYLFPRHKE